MNSTRKLVPLKPIVAIVGRPNVGKSTLFNRLLGSRRAITNDQPGVTRDRIYTEIEWTGQRFTLVDTGGFVPHSKDHLEVAVRTQAENAIQEADLVILLCDGSTGVTDLDCSLAATLRCSKEASLLVVNKIDESRQDRALDPFFSLGLGDPLPVSAATGRCSGDLLDSIVKRFGRAEFSSKPPDLAIKVAIAGRPNVGKSTLINRLAGQQVSIVNDRPGTTRDTTSIRLDYKGREFVLMDTAGIRRRSRVNGQIEYYSALRAASSIERADVVLVLLDSVEDLTAQDVRIANKAISAGCGLLIAFNKWDLIDSSRRSSQAYRQDLYRRFAFLANYPVLFISGLKGRHALKCLERAGQVFENRRSRVPTSRLNKFIQKLNSHCPHTPVGTPLRLLFATQHAVAPPTFVVFSNRPDLVSSSYRRFIENNLRQNFNFEGTPVRIHWRRKAGG